MNDWIWEPYPLGILVIHAAAVRVDGRACIFLGPSGTGKSTICDLLRGAADVLADDMIFVVPRGGAVWDVLDARERFIGGPMSEQEAASLRGTALRAIFRLHQAARVRLKRLPALETCRHLTDAFFDIQCHRRYNVEDKKRAFGSLAAIARSVPGYSLRFSQSPHIGEIIAEAAGCRWEV